MLQSKKSKFTQKNPQYDEAGSLYNSHCVDYFGGFSIICIGIRQLIIINTVECFFFLLHKIIIHLTCYQTINVKKGQISLLFFKYNI